MIMVQPVPEKSNQAHRTSSIKLKKGKLEKIYIFFSIFKRVEKLRSKPIKLSV